MAKTVQTKPSAFPSTNIGVWKGAGFSLIYQLDIIL